MENRNETRSEESNRTVKAALPDKQVAQTKEE